MNYHPALFAAFRISTKTYLRDEPIVRPISHVAGCVAFLGLATIASFIAGNQLDRAAAEKDAELMATFAVPSPLYQSAYSLSRSAAVEEEVERTSEVSAR